MNEDLFRFQDKDDEESEVTSKMGANGLSSSGSNVGGSGGSSSGLKRPRHRKWLFKIEKKNTKIFGVNETVIQ